MYSHSSNTPSQRFTHIIEQHKRHHLYITTHTWRVCFKRHADSGASVLPPFQGSRFKRLNDVFVLLISLVFFYPQKILISVMTVEILERSVCDKFCKSLCHPFSNFKNDFYKTCRIEIIAFPFVLFHRDRFFDQWLKPRQSALRPLLREVCCDVYTRFKTSYEAAHDGKPSFGVCRFKFDLAE